MKSAAKIKTGTTLRINNQHFSHKEEQLSYELLLTTRQKSNIRNSFTNNMMAV